MKTQQYSYTKDGFEAVLYDAGNDDDRLLIVIQGLKGLELQSRYAEMFAGKGYSSLALSYYGGRGQPKTMRAIPLEQFRAACDTLKLYENGRFRSTEIPRVRVWLCSRQAQCRTFPSLSPPLPSVT